MAGRRHAAASPCTGRQTHGAAPWRGVDPIVAAAQIVLGLQTIVSRQVDITQEPAVVTIGAIRGRHRYNIIPDKVEMVGTIRTFDEACATTSTPREADGGKHRASGGRASAEVAIEKPYAVTVNDPALTARMLPTLKRVAGDGNVLLRDRQITGAEDFSFLAQKAPGLVLLPRRHAEGYRSGQGRPQPLAALLRRRIRPAARRARACARGIGLSERRRALNLEEQNTI